MTLRPRGPNRLTANLVLYQLYFLMLTCSVADRGERRQSDFGMKADFIGARCCLPVFDAYLDRKGSNWRRRSDGNAAQPKKYS